MGRFSWWEVEFLLFIYDFFMVVGMWVILSFIDKWLMNVEVLMGIVGCGELLNKKD